MNKSISKLNLLYFTNQVVVFTIASVIILLTDSIIVHVGAYLMFTFALLVMVRFDYLHPYMWYGVFYTLYSVAHPVLAIYNKSLIYTKDLLLIQLLAFVIFAIVITPKRVDKSDYKRVINSKYKLLSAKYSKYIVGIVIIMALLSFSQGTHINKSELYEQGGIYAIIGIRAVYVYLIIYGFNLIDKIKERGKITLKSVFPSALLFIVFFLLTGERDVVLRFVIITFYIYYTFQFAESNKTKLIFGSIILLMLIPLLGQFKYFGLTGQTVETGYDNYLQKFMGAEFSAASRNLQLLLSSGQHEGYFKGYTFLVNVLRGVELPLFSSFTNFSTIRWFNYEYYGRGGMGFTLVGEGYVNFGYSGVVLIFTFISLLIKTIYRKSTKNQFFFVIYVLSIPIFIYSTRADLANILSPLISQIIFGVFLLWALDQIMKGGKESWKK